MEAVSDSHLRALLVSLGVTLGVERYAGQGRTAGAHEFAEKALAVVKAVEGRIDARRLMAR